jgi:hypothetical protein
VVKGSCHRPARAWIIQQVPSWLTIPRFPFIGLSLRAMPPTGTEIETRPFRPSPATIALPDHRRGTGAGILTYPGLTSLQFQASHESCSFNAVIGNRVSLWLDPECHRLFFGTVDVERTFIQLCFLMFVLTDEDVPR